MTAGLAELISRLDDERASVRRLAAMDVAALADKADRAAGVEAIGRRLPRESDEKTALAMIRVLGEAGGERGRPALWSLYADERTPARVAVAAVRAHDRLERLGAGDGA